ncbi:helix-turn-helix domain-containing protein [Ensifer canadensis]|nr:helix-turn-helix domain-containing protein [Ensifer canadensis]
MQLNDELAMVDSMVDELDWQEARRRADILSKLPDRPCDAEVRAAMNALAISRATLFRWLKRFRQDERTSTLLPGRRGPTAGMQPFDRERYEQPTFPFVIEAAR